MKPLLTAFLVAVFLIHTNLAEAKTFTTPSGKAVEVPDPAIVWIWKTWVLPNGLKYVELIPIAKAENISQTEEIELWLQSYADKFNIDPEGFRRLAWCESGLVPTAFNPKDPYGGSYGLFQWLKPSWVHYNKQYGLDLDRMNWHDQVILSAQVLSEKGGWTNWLICVNTRAQSLKK